MWLSGLSIVLPDGVVEDGALRIEDGRIAAIQEHAAVPVANEPFVNARGLIALPGIVDMHGDMIEGEMQPRPGAHFPPDMAVIELDKRLAASGVTTAYAAISFIEVESEDSVRALQRVRELILALNQLRDSLLIDHYVHARYEITSPGVAPVLRELLAAGCIQLVSLMDHTPGQGQLRNLEQFVDYIAKLRKRNPAEVEAEMLQQIKRSQENPEIAQLAEEIAAMARKRNIPIASHDDDLPNKIAWVVDLGATISEFPVTLAAAQEARRLGMATAMGAPNVLRGHSHSGNLSAVEAIKAGVVDIIASDYYPAAILQAVFQLTRNGVLPLHEAAKLASQNPAAAVGLTDRGSLEVGKSADLVLVEPGTRPRVRATLRRGVPIYADAHLAILSSPRAA